MTPEVQLIEGDCLAVLPTLGKVDAVVTDPPYGIGFFKGDSGRGHQDKKSNRRIRGLIHGDDCPFDPAVFLRWPCVMFGADHYCDRLPPGGSFHAWDKRAYSTIEDSFSDVEFIWTSWACKSRLISHLWKGVQQGSEKGRPKYHGSQKPVAVMIQLLTWFTKPGNVILDPYMGSGSTGVACLKTGRDFIGIEQDPRHFAVAERRLKAAETPLFAAMGWPGED